MVPPYLWAGQTVDALQRLGGVWVESLGRDLCAEHAIVRHMRLTNYLCCFLREGSGTFTIDARAFPITAGHLIIAPVHATVSHQFPPDQPLDWYWMAINGPLVEALIHEYQWTEAHQPIYIGCHTTFVPLFEQMLEAIYLQPYGGLILNGLCLQLLSRLGQLLRGAADVVLEPHDVAVTEVITYLSRHLHEPLTLEGLADHFYLSRSQLTKKFRSATGLSPMRYLNYLRINRAEALLYRQQTIASIAEEVGFNDTSSFYSLFKRLKGCTPQQRREQIRTVLADEASRRKHADVLSA
jgi:AraC-like DNA-binding protein